MSYGEPTKPIVELYVIIGIVVFIVICLLIGEC